jgi:predicted RNA methylase
MQLPTRGISAGCLTRDEPELVSVAVALLGDLRSLTSAEIALANNAHTAPPRLVSIFRGLIIAGDDPLGECFSILRSREKRRSIGATYTPKIIVSAMIERAAEELPAPNRVVDPGAGSGRFLIAAGRRFSKAHLLGIEIDPVAALILRANASVLGFGDRLEVRVEDYRAAAIPDAGGPTLFIGNPPYVRHHDIEPVWKQWYQNAIKSIGQKGSSLAGLHLHFFVRTRQVAKPGDVGIFVTSAEWMDVNYGSALRGMLADGLGGESIHVINPVVKPFADALTSAAVTCFRIGNRPPKLTIRSVDSMDELAPLSGGKALDWAEVELASRWSILIKESKKPRTGDIELGQLFRVHRGQVTGSNQVWIAGAEAKNLPDRYLIPCVTKARELFEADRELTSLSGLRRVIDLPVDMRALTTDELGEVEPFLKWALSKGADQGFVSTHRRSWWSVGLREPAPILCTYMARRPPAFVRNRLGARHLNIAHGLYPIESMTDEVMKAVLDHLCKSVSLESGRTYAGGLVKFEPSEVARLHIPEPALTSFTT